MRKSFGAKPFTYPQPVYIIATYDENYVPDAMNAAWGCIADSNKIAIYMAKDHKTTENIFNRKAFTVSMADAAHVTECDYFGVVSANKEPNKIEKAGMHVTKSELVDAPVIDELPMVLECKFISFDEESELLIGEIVNVSADESVLTDGKIDPAKFNPIVFDPCNYAYRTVGEKVGNAFSDGLKLK
ncbi:MAG: flavin reductase family protein [Clostridia bacterium]|nr:flavin reductase family protein [Clostridia bacterium]